MQCQSRGGTALGEDYGAVLNTYPDFAVAKTEPFLWTTNITFTAPLAEGDYQKSVTVTPAIDDFTVYLETESRLTLYINGYFNPETDYEIELAGDVKDSWGQSLGESFVLEFRTPPMQPALEVNLFGSGATFVRPDEPVLYGKVVNVSRADVVVAPISLQEFLPLQNSYEAQQAYNPVNPIALQQTFETPPSQWQDVAVNLTQPDSPLTPGLYYVSVTAPQGTETFKRVIFAASSHINLTFKRGATEALVWAVDLRTQAPVANASVTIYDGAGTSWVRRRIVTALEGSIGGGQHWSGYAVLSQPGENFASISDWSWFVSGWNLAFPNMWSAADQTLHVHRSPDLSPRASCISAWWRQRIQRRYELPSVNEIPHPQRPQRLHPEDLQRAVFTARHFWQRIYLTILRPDITLKIALRILSPFKSGVSQTGNQPGVDFSADGSSLAVRAGDCERTVLLGASQ
jgi:hypothetical protein